MYDGITGLVTQPLRGAEKEGAAGLVKGIGKGIGGLILKPGAGKLFFIAKSLSPSANQLTNSLLGNSRLHFHGHPQGSQKNVWI